MTELLLVLAGSALGGMARFALSGFVGRRIGETFPWGTLAVNVSGSFAIGVVAARLLADGGEGAALAWHFAVYGFLGSYTTVSSFSLQTLLLARDGAWRQAGGNILLSVGGCLPAAAAGFAIGQLLGGSG